MRAVFRAITIAALLFATRAEAQTVVVAPTYLTPGALTDLGNGPAELHEVFGTAQISTSSGSGTGSTSGSSTTLTLTGTPATAPCVGCLISGSGITSGTSVTAFNGTTTITLSAAMTVPASTPLAWGAACPGTPPAVPVLPLQASAGGVYEFYTQARLCAYAPGGTGGALLSFPLGAH